MIARRSSCSSATARGIGPPSTQKAPGGAAGRLNNDDARRIGDQAPDGGAGGGSGVPAPDGAWPGPGSVPVSGVAPGAGASPPAGASLPGSAPFPAVESIG